MADISAEIAAFQNAVYGEEVRSSMVSAIEKINDVAEDAESTVESFSLGVTQAISNANTAASAANTAASNANTKASAANTAATNANTARTAANNAATAANNAASAATATNTNITNAESARVTAEQARTTAESARQANEQSRQTAETARVNAESARASAESSRASAESQRQSTESTRQGNETVRQTQEGLRVSAENSRVNEFEDMQAAFADMQRQIVPQATTSTMGGVIVGDGLNVENALLSLATTKSGSGTAVASNGAVLESVVVYGQSVQEGTPTPDTPVEVQVVEGRNLLENKATSQTTNGVTFTVNPDGTISLAGTATANTALILCQQGVSGIDLSNLKGKTVTLSGGVSSAIRILFYADSAPAFGDSGNGVTFTVNDVVNTGSTATTTRCYVYINSGAVCNNMEIKPQLEIGTTATPYTPYGSISLKVGSTITPIDLNGNVLASLPDGTKDVLTVDSTGHCVLDKRTNKKILDGTESWSNSAAFAYTGKPSDIASVEGSATASILMSDRFKIEHSSAGGNCYISGTNILFYKDSYFNPSSGAEAKTWAAANNITLLYKLATPQSIDLGYIDMPTIPEDATISVSASITPVIDASWWERGAEALANIVKALSERIKALEEAIAELATA